MKNLILTFFSLFLFLSWPQMGLAQNYCKDLVASEKIQSEIRDYRQEIQAGKGWIGSHQYFWDQTKVFNEFSKRLDALEKDPDFKIDNELYVETLHKIILDPKQEPSVSDLQILNASTKKRYVTQSVLHLLSFGEINLRVFQRVNHYWNGKVENFSPERKTLGAKLKGFLKAAYNGPIRFFAPFLPLPKAQNDVDRILEKKFSNPKYEPTNSEIETLKKENAFEVYQTNTAFQKSRPTWMGFRRWVSRAFVAGLVVNGALLANWTGHLAKPEAYVTAPDFFAKAEYRLQPNQVRVYNESVPFPHMAIEIDGKVYSYGQTHMSVKTSQEYLLSDKIQEAAAGPAKKEKAGSINLESAIAATGLDKLPRSVQMVTLNLDPQEKNELKRRLELAEHSRYRNQTLVMDCATMIMKALSESTSAPLPHFRNVPLTLDASPSLMMMYMGMLKSLELKSKDGTQLVGDIKQVAMAEMKNRDLHLWRNLYINAIEGRVFLSFFAFNTGHRTYVNSRYGAQDFQYLQPEVRAEISKWQGQIFQDLTGTESSDPISSQYRVFLSRAQELGSVPLAKRDSEWNQKFQQLRSMTDFFMNREIEATESIYTSADTAFADIIKSGYKREILVKMKEQILILAKTGQAELKLENADLRLTRILNEARPQ